MVISVNELLTVFEEDGRAVCASSVALYNGFDGKPIPVSRLGAPRT